MVNNLRNSAVLRDHPLIDWCDRSCGFGLKSRLPIDNPGVWLDSGAGRAFFIPNPTKYPLSIVSECAVIQDLSPI